jgi:hypothetical protein
MRNPGEETGPVPAMVGAAKRFAPLDRWNAIDQFGYTKVFA